MTSRYSPARLARGLWSRTRTYGQGLGSIVPKLIYGNSAGFRNNFGPAQELGRFRRTSALPVSGLREEPYAGHAATLRHCGYLIFRSKHDALLVHSIRDAVTRAITDPARSVASANGATRHLLDPLSAIPELGELLTEDFCRTITSYYGCPMKVKSVRVWRNHHVPHSDPNRHEVFSNTFHHDATPVTGLRIFVLLCDGVTRETGAFRFHDKRNSAGIIRSLGYFHRDAMPTKTRQRLVDPAKLQFFEGDMGDACICNTQECLHAASIPKAGSFRDILQFEIMPAATPAPSRRALLANVPPDEEILKMARS
jgi:hypothetical protein